MREFHRRVAADVVLDPVPVAAIVADIAAAGTDRQQSLELRRPADHLLELVDQALALFGPPEEIAADVRIEREWARVDDAFTIVMRYDELRVTLGASLLARVPSARFTLRGALGGYTKMGLDPQEEALRSGRTPGDDGWGVEPEERWGRIDAATNGLRLVGRVETRPGDYRAFYENVRDAIAGREPIAVTPEDAIATIRVVELAIRASAERRAIPYDSRG